MSCVLSAAESQAEVEGDMEFTGITQTLCPFYTNHQREYRNLYVILLHTVHKTQNCKTINHYPQLTFCSFGFLPTWERMNNYQQAQIKGVCPPKFHISVFWLMLLSHRGGALSGR